MTALNNDVGGSMVNGAKNCCNNVLAFNVSLAGIWLSSNKSSSYRCLSLRMNERRSYFWWNNHIFVISFIISTRYQKLTWHLSANWMYRIWMFSFNMKMEVCVSVCQDQSQETIFKIIKEVAELHLNIRIIWKLFFTRIVRTLLYWMTEWLQLQAPIYWTDSIDILNFSKVRINWSWGFSL